MSLAELARPLDRVEPSALPVDSDLQDSRIVDGALRLRLSPLIGRGALDGAWWPRSRDLSVEAVDLVDHFPMDFDRICRVVYSTPDWGACSRRVRAVRGFVNLGSFPRDDTHLVMLMSVAAAYRPRPLLLLVVPPAWDDRAAHHAMRIAAMPSNLKSAETIVRESEDLCRAGLLSHWDDDGGTAQNVQDRVGSG
jgi:hypothetical protein